MKIHNDGKMFVFIIVLFFVLHCKNIVAQTLPLFKILFMF